MGDWHCTGLSWLLKIVNARQSWKSLVEETDTLTGSGILECAKRYWMRHSGGHIEPASTGPAPVYAD